ncbi:hypothetical protein OBV_13270 [Oscillibacter valericigenes Sjm18-20]|nr:hypothetical protein OBV_13270 [Oscillibacter valericigenes Sjm18-20]
MRFLGSVLRCSIVSPLRYGGQNPKNYVSRTKCRTEKMNKIFKIFKFKSEKIGVLTGDH